MPWKAVSDMAGKNPFEAMMGDKGLPELPGKKGKRKGKRGGFMKAFENARKKGK